MRKWIVVSVFAITLVAAVSQLGREDVTSVVDAESAKESRNEATGRRAVTSHFKILGIDQFENGVPEETAMEIRWREPPSRSVPMPNGSPLENYQYYKSLAKSGNGFAAYQLASMMRSCSHAFLSQDDLNDAIAQMRETFTFIDPTSGSKVRIGEQEDVDLHIEGAILQFENCSDFTMEQRQEHDRWMELSANNEYPFAMIEYGNALDDPQASMELYRSAWRQGSAHALLSLAKGLERTYDQGVDPAAKVPAYVAMHAFVTLLREAHGADPERIVGRWTLRNQAKLDVMAKEMFPDEIEAAVDLSRQLISSNENCCYSM